ncbi:LacI family transcriptional regulator [Streptomyces sp. NBC_00247]|uniref:LacI family DNA-binding transcriptional regulator n=1 Tax=Streptomyces sp. NBC_00247 TaxID=2975689 RepID=UPI002E2D7EC1|nr:LacI family DNA-binding transcriptional regulator [Streptomyces sp. NBC_00247]
MPKNRPTIADIALRAGVSKVAVSYALNDRPGVSPATRATIKAIAEEIGWRPNSAARALTRARADTVGLALSRPARMLGVEPFFMELISGIESELSDGGCALLLQMVSGPAHELEVYRRWWGEGRVDGVFLADLRGRSAVHGEPDPRVTGVAGLGLPAVAIGHPSAAGALAAVWSDDAAALHDTLTYLHALGHRRVARVAGLAELAHTRLRDREQHRACAELGLEAPVVVHTDYSGDEGAHATRRLVSAPDRPTAIIYDNDIMAVAGLSVAQEMGLDVPADLSLVAWDDSQLSQVVRPPLTALRRDIPAYGALAARTLLTLIAEGAAECRQETTARLVPRGSTAPPR